MTDQLANWPALAHQVAERSRLDDLLLEIGVLQFQLRLEILNFLERPRIDDDGRNVVREDEAPGPGVLAEFSASVPCQYAEGLSFEDDRRDG